MYVAAFLCSYISLSGQLYGQLKMVNEADLGLHCPPHVSSICYGCDTVIRDPIVQYSSLIQFNYSVQLSRVKQRKFIEADVELQFPLMLR